MAAVIVGVPKGPQKSIFGRHQTQTPVTEERQRPAIQCFKVQGHSLTEECMFTVSKGPSSDGPRTWPYPIQPHGHESNRVTGSTLDTHRRSSSAPTTVGPGSPKILSAHIQPPGPSFGVSWTWRSLYLVGWGETFASLTPTCWRSCSQDHSTSDVLLEPVPL